MRSRIAIIILFREKRKSRDKIDLNRRCASLQIERVDAYTCMYMRHNASNAKFFLPGDRKSQIPSGSRWATLRKSKPVTRWLLGNGNRKLVTQATRASGVSRKKGSDSGTLGKTERKGKAIALSVLLRYTSLLKAEETRVAIEILNPLLRQCSYVNYIVMNEEGWWKEIGKETKRETERKMRNVCILNIQIY